MSFQRATENLEDNVQKERLIRLLNRWFMEKSNVVKNLIEERFLGDVEMDYLLRRLADFPDYFSIPDIENALRKEFYNWLQLKGKNLILDNNIPLLGIVIPYERLESHFMKDYGDIFYCREVFAWFIENITDQNRRPYDWLSKQKLDHLRIKPDFQLHWFYWEASGSYPSPWTLFDTSLQAKEGLKLPEASAKYDRQLLFTFNTDKAENVYARLALFGPTWCDADFMQEFEPLYYKDSFGVANPAYTIPDSLKTAALSAEEDEILMIAEAVSRSGYLKLAYLEKCKPLS